MAIALDIQQACGLMTATDSTPANLEDVLRTAADLGHYLADAHVPLHTTGNYNGQRTNQTGIHALWETHNVEHLMASHTATCQKLGPTTILSGTPGTSYKSHRRRAARARGRGRVASVDPSPRVGVASAWADVGDASQSRSVELLGQPTGHRTWPKFCETSHPWLPHG